MNDEQIQALAQATTDKIFTECIEVSDYTKSSIDPVIVRMDSDKLEAIITEAIKKAVSEPDHHLYNLLAVIHGDGGHHTTRVGDRQSVEDAIEKRGKLLTKLENLQTKLKTVEEILMHSKMAIPYADYLISLPDEKVENAGGQWFDKAICQAIDIIHDVK